jgi:hypothetical protein
VQAMCATHLSRRHPSFLLLDHPDYLGFGKRLCRICLRLRRLSKLYIKLRQASEGRSYVLKVISYTHLDNCGRQASKSKQITFPDFRLQPSIKSEICLKNGI